MDFARRSLMFLLFMLLILPAAAQSLDEQNVAMNMEPEYEPPPVQEFNEKDDLSYRREIMPDLISRLNEELAENSKETKGRKKKKALRADARDPGGRQDADWNPDA